jgi:tRNA pseudouridine synthase A
MFGYRDCVVEPASGAEVGAEPAGGAEAAEMQIEGGGEAGSLAGAHLEGACAEEAAGAGAQSPQLAANLAAALRPKVRVRMDLAYDGTFFRGWAAQPGLRTVQGELTEALSTILRVPVQLTVAGRTDAGVHASHQVVHFDVDIEAWQALSGRNGLDPAQALRRRTQALLKRAANPKTTAHPQPGLVALGESAGNGADIVVGAVSQVGGDFDARFSALRRTYRYRVADGVARHDPRLRSSVLWTDQELDLEAMNRSLQPLLGEHEFLSYCKPRQGASTIRSLLAAAWSRPESGVDAGLAVFEVSADAFCHHMVRSLVGATLTVGQGRNSEEWPAVLLARRSRELAAPLAPAHGLTLEAITYPEPRRWAEQAQAARVLRTSAADD